MSIIRLFNNATRTIQGLAYVVGVSVHNCFTNECVSDFSCCCKDIHNPIGKRFKYFLGDMRRMWR